MIARLYLILAGVLLFAVGVRVAAWLIAPAIPFLIVLSILIVILVEMLRGPRRLS